jgi:tetratricopeptide (TPR) repeat protein
MARKLSRIAQSVLWTSALLATCVATGALAQSDVRVTPATKQVVNPFAAKRKAATQAEPAPQITVPPAETGVPKTYQNPFAGKPTSPRYVTPKMHTGPLSRWHRTNEPPASQADPRPVHAVLQDQEVAADELDASDLSGPLIVQQKRSALFKLPEVETHATLSPPDPGSFEKHKISQPAWLVPDASQTATANEESAETADNVRATAQPPIDPFEQGDMEVVLVSDEVPEAAAIDESSPVVKLEPAVVETPESAPAQAETEETELQLVPATVETPIPTAPAAPVAIAEPVAVAELPKLPLTAEEYFAQAEHAAADSASTEELVEVVTLCQRGIEAQPKAELAGSLRSLAAWACNRSGEIESDRRRDDEALQAFELAIQWDPNCWLALHNRAVSRAQQGDLEGALADFNRALQLNPGLAVAYRNRGELLSATGRTEEAANDYTNALAQLPQDAELYAMRGEAYHRMGRYGDALADLTLSIENAPHNAAVYAQRGNVRAEQGDYQQAIADFRQALVVDGECAEAHRSLAWLLSTCPNPQYRNPRQALDAAERAAQLAAPGDPFVLDAVAAAHANAGQFDRAIRAQQEAIANVPGDFAQPFQDRLALYQHGQPFRNGAEHLADNSLVDENVRAASLEAAPRAAASNSAKR